MKRSNLTLILGAAGIAASVLTAQGEITPLKPEWNAENRAALSEGSSVMFLPDKVPSAGAHVAAAVHIPAAREVIWDIVAQPDRASEYLDGIKSCEVFTEGNGRQRVLTVTEFPWLPIEWRYEYRTTHTRQEIVRFEYVRGNLRHFEGHWRLFDGEELGLDGGTVVFYEVFLDPGRLVPRVLVRRNLRKDVPGVLASLRDYVRELDEVPDSRVAAVLPGSSR